MPDASCEDFEVGEARRLCSRKRVVRACWRAETWAKGVVCGRWRCASLIAVGVVGGLMGGRLCICVFNVVNGDYGVSWFIVELGIGIGFPSEL